MIKINEKIPCPTYRISMEPEAVIELPYCGETVTLWRCGLCGEWHGLWPQKDESGISSVLVSGEGETPSSVLETKD